MRRTAPAALLVLVASAAAAQDARWYLRLDNDVAFGTDRWYSSGVRVARVQDGIEWAIFQDVYTPEAKHWRPGVSDRAPTARLMAAGALPHHYPGVFQTLEIGAGGRVPRFGRQTPSHPSPDSAPEVYWSRH